jgi:4-hydroxy-tetrahydrodipicolinate reductase
MRIGIAGITGRMGKLLTEEVAAAGAELSGGVSRGGDIAALAAMSDVVIDFTNASTARAHAAAMAASGKAWVVGTSGLSAADEAAVEEAGGGVPVVYASNFATGVNLVLALAERMGAALPAEAYDAEIVEMHHRQKVDAPSGTAIGFAALRGGQVVGEHTLIFAAGAEHIALTHRAFDRRAFATGAVRAALWTAGREPGLYSMMDVLGMQRM